MPDKYNPAEAKAEPEARHFSHRTAPSNPSLKLFHIARDPRTPLCGLKFFRYYQTDLRRAGENACDPLAVSRGVSISDHKLLKHFRALRERTDQMGYCKAFEAVNPIKSSRVGAAF